MLQSKAFSLHYYLLIYLLPLTFFLLTHCPPSVPNKSHIPGFHLELDNSLLFDCNDSLGNIYHLDTLQSSPGHISAERSRGRYWVFAGVCMAALIRGGVVCASGVWRFSHLGKAVFLGLVFRRGPCFACFEWGCGYVWGVK